MLTWIVIFFGLLLTAAGIFLTIRYNIEIEKAHDKSPAARQSIIRRPTALKRQSHNSRWKAVKIKPGLICCREAELMVEQVYLVADAPVLPLTQCKANDCRCKYSHLDDRRDGDDRREATEYLQDLYDQNDLDRRQRRGRRSTDILARA